MACLLVVPCGGGGLMQSLFGDKDFANDLNRNILEFTMLPFNRLPQLGSPESS